MLGRLLSSTSSECLVGCRLGDIRRIPFGALVKMREKPERDGPTIYGVVAAVHIPETTMARDLALQDTLPPSGMLQHELRSAEPPELRVLLVGYQEGDRILHLLPPFPPPPLTEIEPCTPQEVRTFTGRPRLGYLRHFLRMRGWELAELVAAHLRWVQAVHAGNGSPEWMHRAVRHLIHLLQDDPATLLLVLDALSDAFPEEAAPAEPHVAP